MTDHRENQAYTAERPALVATSSNSSAHTSASAVSANQTLRVKASGNQQKRRKTSDMLRRRTRFAKHNVVVTVEEVSDVEDELSPADKFRRRVAEYQTRWKDIDNNLPPQLSRKHITMISIGGVIGTGVFLGISQSLANGGPAGLLIGYCVVGSIVYSVVISVAEIVSFLPNIGGIVRLADIYVDPALGFAMGWNAWYNWAIILPAEISAATVLMAEFTKNWALGPVVTTIVLSVAVGINCFGARLYGNFEFWFAMGKILTIFVLLIVSLYLDLRPKDGRIGFRYWRDPGAFAQYQDIPGGKGRFLGFTTVLMQAAFSFFGSEVPGIAAGEVIHASKNIPHAVKRIWIRIFLFYILSVFAAGLIVSHKNPSLTTASHSTSYSSPFIIALRKAGWHTFAKVVTIGFVSSAWSAASSDIYISSRYLFFLARCHHAPQFFGSLFRRELAPEPISASVSTSNSALVGDERLADLERRMPTTPQASDTLQVPPATYRSNARRPSSSPSLQHHEELHKGNSVLSEDNSENGSFQEIERDTRTRKKVYDKSKTVPWVGVLVAALIGCLAYLGADRTSSGDVSAAAQAFSYLSAMTSVAALQSWICMLFTYLRWYRGAYLAERVKDSTFKDSEVAKFMHQHRGRFQPYLAIYAFVMCCLILVFNGWSVFYSNPLWVIAYASCDPPEAKLTPNGVPPVAGFLTSYLPLPIFAILFGSYKLIAQTRWVKYNEMIFERGDLPQKGGVQAEDNPEDYYSGPPPMEARKTRWGIAKYWFGKIWYHLI